MLAKISTAYQNKGTCQVCGYDIQVGELFIRSKETVGLLHAEYCGEDEADWITFDRENENVESDDPMSWEYKLPY